MSDDKTASASTTNDSTNEEDEMVSSSTKIKRAKTQVLLKDVFSPEILSTDKDGLKATYKHATPYPHGHLPNLFQKDFIQQVITEIKDNSVVNFKESDLFKVYQSIDLANLKDDDDDDVAGKMPAVLQLRQVLYSDEWRRFMEEMNELEPGSLSNQVDCACNCHMSGCHLLCHDDVIGTRKISYILYLTEPEPEWTAVEGGALELYDSKIVNCDDKDGNGEEGRSSTKTTGAKRRIPDTVPSKTLLPIFNHMAFFVVEPGFSFHAVQEVLGDRPRLSLQGWYHAAEAPANIQDATLQRLKSYQGEQARKEEDTEGEYQSFLYSADDRTHDSGGRNDQANPDSDDSKTLSAADRAYLSKFLHETYLKDEAIAEIRERFEEDSSVQLRNFLSNEWVERLKAVSGSADGNSDGSAAALTEDPTSLEYYQKGVTDNWKIVGPAHKQRFLEYSPSSTQDTKVAADVADAMGDSLYCIRTELLQSPAFGRFLGLLTSLGLPTAHRGRVRRFRPGRDYTVAHYGLLTDTSVLDATLCFCAGKGGEPVAAPKAEKAVADDGKAGSATAVDDEPVMLDEADEIWQSGDCGGFECYIAADDENGEGAEPADEYNQDDDTELLSVSASNNTLSLVYRDPGTMRFIKYVGAKAPSSRWDVAMEYEVPEEDEEEQGDQDEEEVVDEKKEVASTEST